MSHNERHIIISCQIDASPGNITVDVGDLSPHIAFCVLQQALDVLEAHGAEVTVVHNGRVIEDEPEEMI